MKRLFIFISILCLALPVLHPKREACAAAYAVSATGGAIIGFSDIEIYFPSEWAAESAKLAERLGIGYQGRIEKYNRKLTRKELAYVAVNLYRVIARESSLTISDDERNKISAMFTDSSKNGKLFDDEVFLAIKHNLMYGTSDNQFSPDGFVTREQTAAVLYRIVERVMDMSDVPRADLSIFADSGEISDYANDCLSAMVGYGVLSGVSADMLAPKNVCTYEEVLSIAVRFAGSLEGGQGLDLYPYIDALLESPDIVNIHTTEIDYQGKQTEILDAEWLPREGAIGYAVDCRTPDGKVLRTLTTNEGVTIFEADLYDEIQVYSIGASNGGKAGIIGEDGSSLMNPVDEMFSDYTGIYVYNDYAALISAQAEEEYLFDYTDSSYGGSNPKNITYKKYSSSAEAMADMTEITVRIWKMGENNTRVPGTATIYVYHAVAQDVIDIFEDIYNRPEKFPIYAVAGYNWRGANSKSSHNQGLAIDINPDHNYFINTKGKILAGKMWNPSLSPYSIKPDGDVVRAFNKKGWFWAGIGWASTGKDYMHFSYTGV